VSLADSVRRRRVEQPISLCENMTSSTKPEICNVSLRRQKRTEPRQQVTCGKKLVKIGRVVLEIGCRQTNTQTDRQTSSPQYSAPVPGPRGVTTLNRHRGVDGSCAQHLTVESYTVFICQQSYLLLFGIPSPTNFHSRLKTFLFCKSFPPQPFLFLLRDSLYTDSPNCLLLFLTISVFYF